MYCFCWVCQLPVPVLGVKKKEVLFVGVIKAKVDENPWKYNIYF